MDGIPHRLRLADDRLEALIAHPVSGAEVLQSLLYTSPSPLPPTDLDVHDREGRQWRLRITEAGTAADTLLPPADIA